MNLIPIVPATLDIIEVLNNGVRPELKSEETFFLYKGKDEIPEIINREKLDEYPTDEYWTLVKTLWMQS